MNYSLCFLLIYAPSPERAYIFISEENYLKIFPESGSGQLKYNSPHVSCF